MMRLDDGLITHLPIVARTSSPDFFPKHRVNRPAHALMPPFLMMNWSKGSESGLYAAACRGIWDGCQNTRDRDAFGLLVGAGLAALIKPIVSRILVSPSRRPEAR